MEQTRDMGFQMVGKIFWDPQIGRFNIDNGRPQFKGIVQRYMNNRQDRCHSISFHLLSVLLCDFSNNLNSEGLLAAIGHMQMTFGIGIQSYYSGDDIPGEISQAYLNQLNHITVNLCNKINLTGKGAQIENELSQFLSHLNSCPYNLRYPVNANFNWNQVVGAAFDPRMWCYVDRNRKVISDDQSLFWPGVTTLNAYCMARRIGIRPGSIGAGFYLLDIGDSYLLSRMFDLDPEYLSNQYLAAPQLFLYTSVTNQNGDIPANVPYLSSSSNNYPVQANNTFKANIYFYNIDTRKWRLFERGGEYEHTGDTEDS